MPDATGAEMPSIIFYPMIGAGLQDCSNVSVPAYHSPLNYSVTYSRLLLYSRYVLPTWSWWLVNLSSTNNKGLGLCSALFTIIIVF